MTRRSIFQEPKCVLVFSSQRVLISMHQSLNIASREMKIPAQSISLCCLGYNISCYGYYFRHYLPEKVEIIPHLDFGKYRLEEYDESCQLVRRYHDIKELNRRRLSAENRRKNKKDDTNEKH